MAFLGVLALVLVIFVFAASDPDDQQVFRE